MREFSPLELYADKTDKTPTGSMCPVDPNVARAPIGSLLPGAGHTGDCQGTPADDGADGQFSDSVSNCEPYPSVILAKLQLGLSATRIHQDLAADDPEHAPSYPYNCKNF